MRGRGLDLLAIIIGRARTPGAFRIPAAHRRLVVAGGPPPPIWAITAQSPCPHAGPFGSCRQLGPWQKDMGIATPRVRMHIAITQSATPTSAGQLGRRGSSPPNFGYGQKPKTAVSRVSFIHGHVKPPKSEQNTWWPGLWQIIQWLDTGHYYLLVGTFVRLKEK